MIKKTNQIADLIRASREAEREACAKIADAHCPEDSKDDPRRLTEQIADAIRARK